MKQLPLSMKNMLRITLVVLLCLCALVVSYQSDLQPGVKETINQETPVH